MQYHVVTFTHTKIIGWAIYLYAHIKYLKKLLKEDKLQISGPGVGTPVRSAQLVFKVTDRDELDRLIAGDPYYVHGLVASLTVNLWNVDYGSMLKPAVPDKKGTRYFRATFALNEGTDISDVAEERDDYIRRLINEKKLRASGFYVNHPTSGLSILSVANTAEAETIMRNDPLVAKLGAEYQVIQWDPRFGEF